jgi:hypothetical protein
MTTLSITRPGGWRLRSGLLAFTLALFVPLAIPATASASNTPSGNFISSPQGNEFVNNVEADSPADGNQAFKVKFQLGVGVTNTVSAFENATAVTDCSDCSAVAIGFQVVTTTDSYLTTLHTQGIASATNYVCTPNCTAVADAFQVVVATDTPSALNFGQLLSPGQLVELYNIRSQVLALPNSGLTIPQILNKCQQLVGDVDSILTGASYGSFTSFTLPAFSPAIHGVGTATELTGTSQPIVKLYHDLQVLPTSAG